MEIRCTEIRYTEIECMKKLWTELARVIFLVPRTAQVLMKKRSARCLRLQTSARKRDVRRLILRETVEVKAAVQKNRKVERIERMEESEGFELAIQTVNLTEVMCKERKGKERRGKV